MVQLGFKSSNISNGLLIHTEAQGEILSVKYFTPWEMSWYRYQCLLVTLAKYIHSEDQLLCLGWCYLNWCLSKHWKDRTSDSLKASKEGQTQRKGVSLRINFVYLFTVQNNNYKSVKSMTYTKGCVVDFCFEWINKIKEVCGFLHLVKTAKWL